MKTIKSILVTGLVFGLGLVLSACGADEPQDVMDIITAITGKTRVEAAAAFASGGTAGQQFASGYGPDKCFDGIAKDDNTAHRYLGQMKADPSGGTAGGVFVQLDVPAEVLPEYGFFNVVSYEVHRLSSGNDQVTRAPTQWKLEGNVDGTTWTTIDTRADITWTEQVFSQTFEPSTTVPWFKIRFTPLASNKTGAWDVGLYELVYKVVAAPGLAVFHGEKARGCDGFSHADGEVIVEDAATVTAPSSVTTNGIVFTCAGYELRALDGLGSVVTNVGTSYSYVADGNAHALTWLWACNGTTTPVTFQRLAYATDAAWSVEGTSAANGYGPEKAFDGIAYVSDDHYRWICSLGGTAVIKLNKTDDQWQGLLPKLVSYRLYQHSSGYSCNSRAPTAWKVEGSVDGSTWEPIETVSGYAWVSQRGTPNTAPYWTGTAATEKAPSAIDPPAPEDNVVSRDVTCGKSYVGYRFTPTASRLADPNGAGLMEIEFLLSREYRGQVLIVQSEQNFPGINPVCGGYFVASTNCTAPEVVFRDGRAYRCAGYRKETRPSGTTAWGAPVVVESCSFEYVRGNDEDVRITWLWEDVGVRLAVSPRDGGLETFAYDSAGYVNPDEPNAGYYAYNTTATVTVCPSADPVSIFTGEILGDVGGVTVSGNTLTVPMGTTPRALEACFDRHWKWTHGRDASGSVTAIDYLTDGNWTIALSPYLNPIAGHEAGKCYRLARGYADGGIGGYVSGRGRLDLTHVNADLAAQEKMPLIYLTMEGFANVDSLTELVVPADITSGYSNPFVGCVNLKRVVWNPDCAFWNVDPSAHEIAGCFKGCTALETAVVTNLTRLPSQFFSGCTALSNVVFGTRLGQIEPLAFEGCTSFAAQTLALPRSVTNFVLNAANPPRANTFFNAKFDTLDLSQLTLKALPSGTLNGCVFNQVVFNKRMKELPYPNMPSSVGAQPQRYVFCRTPPTEFATGDYLWTCGVVAPRNLISEWKKDSRFIPFEDCVTNEALKARTDIYNYFIRDKSDPTCVGGWNNELLFTGENADIGGLMIFVR